MFYNKLDNLINKHAPLVPVSKRKAKLYYKRWITKGIRKSIKIKNSLFYLRCSDKYKYYRNKILPLTQISKKAYYHKYFEDNFANIKKTWIGINNIITYKKKNVRSITSLKFPNNNTIATDVNEIPNILNKHFSSVGNKVAAKMQNAKLPKLNNPGSTKSTLGVSVLSSKFMKKLNLRY